MGNIFKAELKNHIKFTIWAVISSLIIIVVVRFFILSDTHQVNVISQGFFEIFFDSHLFFASLTPAALFSIYNNNFFKGFFIAIITSSITCTLSDIIFPYIGGLILNYNMSFHLCIIEEPLISWSFIVGGGIIGFFLSKSIRKLSRFTHTAHIFISSLAAGLYLISYGVEVLEYKSLLFLPILIFSVLIPCVMNDIGVPTFIVTMSKEKAANRDELLKSLHDEHHGHKH